MSATPGPRVVPAQLSFLAIYNPALGDSDETFHRQIVFYYARAAKARAKLSSGNAQGERLREGNERLREGNERLREGNERLRDENERLREEENEKLRQVGLAQGMVGFARSFSNGETVDSIETDKARIVLHELEAGWWVLASVDLTQLPAAPAANTATAKDTIPAVEYSSREVSPPALLVQQLVRAHAVFTLHHGWPLQQLLAKHGRDKFCSILATYWARFAARWDVLLHGSPAVDMFHGLKLAAGGELGMGVGEEEWGSSERDVLEDFARRTEGLVDVVVSRFGEASPTQHPKGKPASRAQDESASTAPHNNTQPWIGGGGHVAATDGVVFSGVGGLSRASLRDVSHWTETIYHYGDHAYGIRDNPTSDRRKRRRRNAPRQADPVKPNTADKSPPHDSGTGDAPRIPPPIVKAVESSLDRASKAIDDADGRSETTNQDTPHMLASLGDTETWIKYMTLGYGTAWGGKKQDALAPTPPNTTTEQSMRYVDPAPDVDLVEEKRKAQIQAENDGYFLIGLKGDMVEADMDDENDEGNWNARIPLRTVYVEQINKGPSLSDSDETPSEESKGTTMKLEKARLRPVVYVHRPFIYTFLFAHRTPSLTLASFYRSLHSFFAPLHRSLDRNTAPTCVAQRLLAAQTTQTTTTSSAANPTPIYDLVWDPRTLTVHSSIPNIPDPGTFTEILPSKTGNATHAQWSRLDALNVHAQILATGGSTRRSLHEIERTCKTARGWWVVWMRLPPSQPSDSNHSESDSESSPPRDDSIAFNTHDLREAFLVRRARDAETPTHHTKPSGMWSMSMGMGLGLGGASQSERMGGKKAGWGPKGLAEGIGVDARRYVDELLSLNR